jgi:alanine dehydrogenase
MSGDNPLPPSNGGPDCANIIEQVPLNSPKSEVVSRLKPRSVLKLEVHQEGGRNILVAVNSKGQKAGTITTASSITIINCILTGFNFIAIVISIDRGDCMLEIRPEIR